MNLVIDIGNTQAKVAVFEQTILQFKDQFLQSELLSGLLDVTEQYNIKKGHMDFQSIALPTELRHHRFKRLQI